MSTTLSCDAILFDLDGVLVDSRAAVERTWRRWSALHDMNVPGLIQRAHGRRTVETVRDVAPHLDADREVRWLAEAELADFDGIAALPGAATILAALREREWAIVTSGGNELARRRLRYAGLPAPTVLVAAEQVRTGKPAPDGYLLAASELGVEPGRCVVIEDTPPGIHAGRAAQARVLALSTTFPDSALTEADTMARSLADVRLEREQSTLLLHIAHAPA